MTPSPKVLWLHSHFQLPTGGTKYIFEVSTTVVSHVAPLERP